MRSTVIVLFVVRRVDTHCWQHIDIITLHGPASIPVFRRTVNTPQNQWPLQLVRGWQRPVGEGLVSKIIRLGLPFRPERRYHSNRGRCHHSTQLGAGAYSGFQVRVAWSKGFRPPVGSRSKAPVRGLYGKSPRSWNLFVYESTDFCFFVMRLVLY